MTLLSVEDLTVRYHLGGDELVAGERASFELKAGESLGLIGESGCGKSTLAAAVMRLLPPTTATIEGRVVLEGQDLLTLSEAELRKVRWERIATIFQSAMNSLNPVRPARTFLEEALRIHTDMSPEQVRKRVAECFELVGLPASRINAYPHELSGGMTQRVVIALSLVCEPSVVFADEPTTALDVIVQDQVMQVIRSLRDQLGFALVLISHDMALIAENCDRVAVMYAGQIVEQADIRTLFSRPRHPYTIGLLRSIPRLRGGVRELPVLPGQPPDLLRPPPGCRFASRCPLAEARCVELAPELLELERGRWARCHFAADPRVERLAARAAA
jgi:oligopeptide/dipeptide ABC transporter ATP-binding protein